MEIQKFGMQQNKNRVAQNIGKVWISRKQILLAPFGAIPGNFFHGPEKIQKYVAFCLFSLVGQWALFTRCGLLLLSTRGEEIGIGDIPLILMDQTKDVTQQDKFGPPFVFEGTVAESTITI